MNDYISTTQQTVQWFKQRNDMDELEMSPPYQRNPVWLYPQKSYLIDTILRGFPIPEIYMQEVISADGASRHILVDGQQRIRACLEFLAGEFELSGKESPEWEDMGYEDLSPEDKKKILGYKFVVRTLPEMSDDRIREIFSRLNRNTVALNQQELRHAMYWGEFIQLVDKISDMDFWVESNLFTPNDFRRMLDREYVSELVVGVLHGPQNKKQTLDTWYETYETDFPRSKEVQDIFYSVTGEISQVLPELGRSRWSKKSDFYSLFLVLAKKRETFPLPREARKQLHQLLVMFGEAIDNYDVDIDTDLQPGPATVDPLLPDNFRNTVRRYALAVQRAASDIANRRIRQQMIEVVLDPVWSTAEHQNEIPVSVE